MPMSTTAPSSQLPIPRSLLVALFAITSTVYLTRISLVPGVANNIGLFELSIGLFVLVTIFYFIRYNLPIYSHFVLTTLIFISLLAAIGLLKLTDRPLFALVQWLLLVYAVLLVGTFYNWLRRYPTLVRHLLRFLSYTAVVAAFWVMVDGFLAGGDPDASGPFRNRAHISIHLLSAFWIILLYISLPDVSKRERFFFYFSILAVLYGIAIAGRRSAYLSLGAGFVILGLCLPFYIRRGYGRIAPIFLITITLFSALYFIPDIPFLPTTFFFRARIATIEQRLRLFSGDESTIADSDNFALLQRQGMWEALNDHPILGIGWGGFYESAYSPTGHEMHSTPQRFLTELGLVGFGLYLALTGYLLFAAGRLWYLARGTPYEITTLILAIAMVSLHISWFYNRSTTDRMYWLLIIILMGLEILLRAVPSLHHPTRLPISQPTLPYAHE